jgi:(2Fe-2S) ferredoxin
MNKPEYHFFICNSYRIGGEAQGACNKKGATDLLQYLEGEILDRGLDAAVSSTGCLKACTEGPVMVLYPHAKWFGQVTEEKIDDVLDALQAGDDTADMEL